MPRAIKQILYGLFYLGILAAIVGVWVLVSPKPKEIATCTDSVQNQNEIGVDCGGLCDSCELKDLRLEIVTGLMKTNIASRVAVLEVGEKSSLLVKVKNPSNNFGAPRVPYEFKITGLLEESIGIERGELNILPGEEKYIAEVGLNVKASNIGGVIFELGDFKFVSKEDLADYDIKIENVETSFPEQSVQAGGLFINNSSSALSRVVLTALFYTKEGDLANVGTVLLNNLGAFRERDFIISVPRNSLLIDIDQTEISWRMI